MKNGFQHTVIRASAGTGKTYQLTNRFIGLLYAGVSPQQILATTFTRKAAGEIFDRVLLRLAEAAHNERSRADLSRAIGASSPLSRDECLALLLRTVRGMDALRVSTLDSFFSRIATSFALEMGLPPGWNICDERTDAQIREEAIEAVLAREKTSDLLTLMNLLTKGEAKRSISQLVSSTVAQLYNLFRETDPDAWQKIPRVKALPAEELGATIDRLRRIEMPSQMATARNKDCEAVLAGDWDAFIKTGLGPKVLSGENVYQRKPIPDEAVVLYDKLLKQAASQLVSQVALQTEGTFELLRKFSEEYERLKHARRALRFDDITYRLAHAMGQAGEQLAYRLDSGISHVLLDEFQDTSLLQWHVLRPLAQRVTCGDGSFFCVGDAKQAIYGWRGGLAELFDALGTELRGLQHDALTTSYRSSQPVIDTVNHVFKRLTDHDNLDRMEPAVRDWQKRFPDHTTARNELAGYVTLQAAPAAEDGEDEKDVLFRFTAEQIAESVKRAPGASVGVLVRTNEAVARLIHLLRELGIPASEEGGNPLTDSAPISVILSLLRLADHPGDTVARFHVANSPLAGMLQFDGAWSYDDRAAELSRRVRRQLLDDGYGRAIYEWARVLAPHCSARDLNRLQQLIELAFQYQADSSLRCDDFVEFVEGQRMADPTRDDVRVMTIHQSKGLQFDIVYLPELESRILGQNDWFVAGRSGPTQPIDVVCRYANQQTRQLLPKRIQDLFDATVRQDVDEALCVLYVALTRAVHALHMVILPQEKPGKLPKTYSGLLRAALCEGRALGSAEVGYQAGDPNWYTARKAPSKPVLQTETKDGEQLPRSLPFAKCNERRRGLERASPSQLEGGQRLPLADVFRPQAIQARHRGTLIHAWMQLVTWLDQTPPGEKALAEVADRLVGEIGDVALETKTLAAEWKQWLAQPAVKEALCRDFYQTAVGDAGRKLAKLSGGKAIEFEVQNERPFAVRDGEQLLVGTIDRLVLIRAGGQLIGADVIDFKTDQLSRDNPRQIDERTDFYRPQLEAYRRAVAGLYGIDPSRITTRLIFLTIGEVRTVSK